MKTLTRDEMLNAVAENGSEFCAPLAKRIVAGKTPIELQRKFHTGGFMAAVLDGNFEKAMIEADGTNRRALEMYAAKLTQ